MHGKEGQIQALICVRNLIMQTWAVWLEQKKFNLYNYWTRESCRLRKVFMYMWDLWMTKLSPISIRKRKPAECGTFVPTVSCSMSSQASVSKRSRESWSSKDSSGCPFKLFLNSTCKYVTVYTKRYQRSAKWILRYGLWDRYFAQISLFCSWHTQRILEYG